MRIMSSSPQPPRSVFDNAALEYDAARPSYPSALYDAVEAAAGPLAGRLVLDWGAGTGISARQLAARGARVVLLDIGEQMLRRARGRDADAVCVLADGNQMPLRAESADLTTFAQSWHWFAKPAAPAQVARVLRPGGYWAAWWNRSKADGESWFENYQDVLESSCPGYTWRRLQDELMVPEWDDPAVTAVATLEPRPPVIVPWTRQVGAADWFTDERSKSYVIDLDPGERESVLEDLGRIVATAFPGGQMVVPYITTLLMARKAG
jgi:ubiquinone/menaquinone biosynthesis C-methylase UbiE